MLPAPFLVPIYKNLQCTDFHCTQSSEVGERLIRVNGIELENFLLTQNLTY